MGKLIDLTGRKFGMLTVVSISRDVPGGNIKWECLCDCGGTKRILGCNLTSGNTM